MSSGLIVSLFIAISMGEVAAQQAPTTPSAIGLIAGRVLNASGGQPLAGVTVSMTPGPGSFQSSMMVLTDALGRFAFSALPSGRYTLRVQHDGYAHVRGAAVNLLAGQLVTDVELQAGRHGVIAGTVRDDTGDPIVGVAVISFSRRVLGFRPMLVPGRAAVSDDRGQFRIADLPPGEYLVCACQRDSLPIDKSLLARVAPGGIPASSVARQLNGAVLTFPPTFHPGSTRVADAVSITVGYSDDRRGIDITMQPVSARRVSGRLVGDGSNASTTHTLTLIAAGDDPAAIGISELPAARMTPEGAFDFAAVPPGKYSLEAYPSNGKPGLSASVTVTVGDSDVADLMVPLGPGATVRGRVEFSGAAARPDGNTLEKTGVHLVPIVLTPAAMISIGSTGSVGYSGTLSREGSFAMEGVLPGRYMVNAGQFGTVWRTIESVSTTEGRSFQPVVDVNPAGSDSLVVTMSDVAMATIEVTLSLGKYEVPNEVSVAIFPVDRTFWSETYLAPGTFAFGRASATGVVSFPPLPPGDYYVVSIASTEAQASPERMTEWANRAKTVRLRSGENTSVALRRPGL